MNKPRVAHISTTYLKSSETFIYNFVNCHKKYEPHVITEEWINKDEFPTQHVYEMRKLNAVERAQNLFSKQFFIRNIASEKHYGKFIEKIKPAVILAHFGQIGVYATPLKKKYGIPLVTYFYGIDLDYRKLEVELGASGSRKFHIPLISKRDYWKKGYERLWREGDAFLTFSKESRAHLISSLGAPEEKVFSIPGGIDLNKFKFNPRTLPDDGRINFTTVNRLVEKKGVEYAIKAFSKVLKKYPKARYDIMGSGPLLDSLQALVDNLGIGRSVTLLGFTQTDIMLKKLDESHVFLNPSVVSRDGDIEGWVNVTLMESIAMGLPPITTFESGSETVIPGVTGYLCAQRDADDLAEKIFKLLNNPEKYAEISRNARKHAEENFSNKKQTAKLEDLFDSLV